MSAYKGPHERRQEGAASWGGAATSANRVPLDGEERKKPTKEPTNLLGSRQQGALELFAVRDDLLIPCSARRATRIDIASCSNVIAAAR